MSSFYREVEYGGFWTDPSGNKIVLAKVEPDIVRNQFGSEVWDGTPEPMRPAWRVTEIWEPIGEITASEFNAMNRDERRAWIDDLGGGTDD